MQDFPLPNDLLGSSSRSRWHNQVFENSGGNSVLSSGLQDSDMSGLLEDDIEGDTGVDEDDNDQKDASWGDNDDSRSSLRKGVARGGPPRLDEKEKKIRVRPSQACTRPVSTLTLLTLLP